MIRFTISNGLLKPLVNADPEADPKEIEIANQIAQRLNNVQGSSTSYKSLMEGLNQSLQQNEVNAKDYVDENTIQEIENFYEKASGLKAWDPQKQGAKPEEFDAKFYSKLVPDQVKAWNDAKTSVSFAGLKIPDVDITRKYADLDGYLHSDYTFVGGPSGRPGKQRTLETYQETLRAPTDRERQVLRETLLGTTTEQPESLIEKTAQNYVDVQGERTFGALSADVLKQTLNEYQKNLKQEQMSGMLTGMGMPSVSNFKQDIKNSILGDIGAGGFLSFGKGQDVEKGLSKTLDQALGIGSSVKYNWQEWFDKTLAERYQNMSEIQDPTDAAKTYKIEKEFADKFVNDYLKPRFDTSKSISEFVSYMDVKAEEENVLQTQLASTALKDFANKQTNAFLGSLGATPTVRDFDPKFYWDPFLLTGTDVTQKASLYENQKTNVQDAWLNKENNEPVKNGKTWNQLAYEYGVDLNNKDDFARLHYAVIGKEKGFDPVADSYTKEDLARFIQEDLTKALEQEKASYSSPVFSAFVSADAKAKEMVDKLNVQNLPADLQKKLQELGVSASEDPIEQVKESLAQILRTDPALEIREQIRQLNEEQIKPTQEQLGAGYIQRDADEVTKAPTGGSALFNVFKKAGYGGSEKEFYTEFFPDATEEDKNLGASKDVAKPSGNAFDLLGFSLPDMSDPFSAMASIDKLFQEDQEDTYTKAPSRSTYFDIFKEDEDAGAPSYFKIGTSSTTKTAPTGQSFLSGFSSIFG